MHETFASVIGLFSVPCVRRAEPPRAMATLWVVQRFFLVNAASCLGLFRALGILRRGDVRQDSLAPVFGPALLFGCRTTERAPQGRRVPT